jgi:hypothetical protein
LEDGIKINKEKARNMDKDFNLYQISIIIKGSSLMVRKMAQE